MNILRNQVRKALGLCCITECEQDPPRVLKRTRIDENDEQNSNAKKRPRLSEPSQGGNAGYDNVTSTPKGKKFPSEAPPHRRRSILVVKPKGSKVPRVKVLPPCPGTPPVTSPNRGRDYNLLHARWKSLATKRKSKTHGRSLISHKKIHSGNLSKGKPILEVLQPSEESVEATIPQNETPSSSNASDCNLQITNPELLETDLFGDALPISDLNTTNFALQSNDVAYATRTETIDQLSEGACEQSSPKAPRVGLESKQEFRETNELRRSKRLQASHNSAHTPFTQKSIDSTTDLLVQIAIFCSEQGPPDEATIIQLRKLLKSLPVLLTMQGSKDHPKESAKFRSAMNEHELSLNWGDLDSIEELHNTVCSIDDHVWSTCRPDPLSGS